MAELVSPFSWLELHRANLVHNLARLKALVGQAGIMAVLKANAYGAGAVGIAQVLAAAGVDAFAVADVREGIELRDNGITGSILCLTYFTRDEAEPILEYHLTPTLWSLEAAHWIADRARAVHQSARVWVKVDTGLGRLGVPFEQAAEFCRQVAGMNGLELQGLLTTLTENPVRDRIQVDRLLDVSRRRPELGVRLSAASSHGILSLRESYLDVVRPGIMLLGWEPSERERMDLDLVRQMDLRPIVTWKTRVGYVKSVGPGEQIGYGNRPVLTRHIRVATLTIGWAAGYPATMERGGHVLIQGQPCPVIAVSAHSTMVDVTAVDQVALGDPVVLLGEQANTEITAAELVRVSAGSVYRLLSSIPRETPRIWK